jgi:hypothetical protein
MSVPPHSVEPRPSSVESDRYMDRNNFLNLLLGLISTAEQILAFAPDLASDPPPGGRDKAGVPLDRKNAGSMMR